MAKNGTHTKRFLDCYFRFASYIGHALVAGALVVEINCMEEAVDLKNNLETTAGIWRTSRSEHATLFFRNEVKSVSPSNAVDREAASGTVCPSSVPIACRGHSSS